MKMFVLFAVCFSTVSAVSLFQAEWESWKAKHCKQYDYGEDVKRQHIWNQNLKKVISHNMEADQGLHTYILGMNQFADMGVDEWRNLVLSDVTRPASRKSKCKQTYECNDGVSDSTVDWRTKGYVTPVKDQGQCGSCWAFSATGSLEGQHFNKTGMLVSLSEQNLIDCSRLEGNYGCEGGLMDNAFEYILKNGGIDTESSYPYKAKDGKKCLYNPKNRGATLTGCVDITSGSEKALRSAVQMVGPISVAIDAGHDSFMLYQSGIYSESACSSTRLDHAVLAVGYGAKLGKSYWLVKNSWGTKWGMAGYIMMSRGNKNNCGIATQASYPTV